jgi:hypothetical protein
VPVGEFKLRRFATPRQVLQSEMVLPVDVQLGKRLRMRRRALGLTLVDLGNITRLKPGQLQRYECAASGMSAAMIVKLAVALEVKVSYFFDGL